MGRSYIILVGTLYFLATCSVIHAQLTPEQIKIQEQARSDARKLLFGSNVVMLSEFSANLLNYTASRLEQQMLKVAATKQWENVKPAPVKSSDGRRLLTLETESFEESSTGRSLQSTTFKPYDVCKLSYGKNYIGGNIRNNFIRNMMKWQDCCKKCSKRTDCVAWTINKGSDRSKRGCWLKGKGYWSKGAGSFISGKMIGRDSTTPPSPPPPFSTVSPDPYAFSPPPPSLTDPITITPPPISPPNSGVPDGKGKYGEVLGLSWKFYEAQRSGPTPPWNRISWRRDSHLTDFVVGGWYDAGDYLKLNFPLAPGVGLMAWGLLEFKDAYQSAGELTNALNSLRLITDYLSRSLDWTTGKYSAQIGDPNIDHGYWGRPEEQTSNRPHLLYDRTMAACDLYGGVAGTLAASSMVFRDNGDPAYADELMRVAKELYTWGTEKEGKYSNFYTQQTKSIYPSTDWEDNMAWASGWMYHATSDVTYLDRAFPYWTRGKSDYYPSWDSVWAPHAAHMVTLAAKGTIVPGIDTYRAYMANFTRAWVYADGYQSIVKTPLGMHYPSWNEWANLAFSSTSSSILLMIAKYEGDPTARALQIDFARKQIDYALGSGIRSYVIGYGNNPPRSPHHASSSCPNLPAPCNWDNFRSLDPNPQTLFGALVGGPAGVRKNSANPDDSYIDKRSNYVTNEVALDYNSGFTTALAGLYALL